MFLSPPVGKDQVSAPPVCAYASYYNCKKNEFLGKQNENYKGHAQCILKPITRFNGF